LLKLLSILDCISYFKIVLDNSLGGDIPPLPVGRGAVRGRRQIDLEHFRTPRPESSLGKVGKQGKVLFKRATLSF